ncbi:mitochondrial ribonuclease P catalytic subunit-like [Ptychodera flava]|uniref:mitochondrial ribonuclease P catalytic subunit-like n=1 Tax=Ptychodera flava TaxID=63121 RepID=UPI00396A9685
MMSLSAYRFVHQWHPLTYSILHRIQQFRTSKFSPIQYALHQKRTFQSSCHQVQKRDEDIKQKNYKQNDQRRLSWKTKKLQSGGHRQKLTFIPKEIINMSKANDVNTKVQDGSTNVKFGDEPDRYLSVDEWQERWTGNPRFCVGVMGKFAGLGHIQKAKSLMDFMNAKNMRVDEAVLHNFLSLCVSHNHFDEMFRTYKVLKEIHQKLPGPTLGVLIDGFCKTSSWRQSIEFLEQLKLQNATTSRSYCKLLVAALKQGELELGEKLFTEMVRENMVMDEASMTAIIRTFSCYTDDKSVAQRNESIVHKLIQHWRQEQIYPPKEVGYELIAWFKSKRNEKWRAGYSDIDDSGVCNTCGTKLEKLMLTTREFQIVHDEVMEKVIKSKDVFLKTSPEELESFIEFVNESEAYDVVIDGLNVAHLDPFVNNSEQLRQVVVYFAEQLEKRVLLIGRQHMLQHHKKWHKYNMDWIRDIADCFFADNVSQDDPFLLYATLHSGEDAVYVSRDMMRDHRALLSPQTLKYFLKWQRSHQYVPVKINKYHPPRFQQPCVHETIAQTDGFSWHIPVHDGAVDEQWKLPHQWICATLME